MSLYHLVCPPLPFIVTIRFVSVITTLVSTYLTDVDHQSNLNISRYKNPMNSPTPKAMRAISILSTVILLTEDFVEPTLLAFGNRKHLLVDGICCVDVHDVRYLFLSRPPDSTLCLAVVLGTV